ncbi:hypothetical protein G6L37_00215 [Agrobacterium rubi]|nr:hypothetical protein [Agrobacterium rubi]NTF23674.1 hypothetical protein [Agrobacterium rubi]
MTKMRVLSGSFGGAYLGSITLKIPSMLGYSYVPTQRADLIAALIGLVVGATICTMEYRRERKESTPIKLGR